MAFTRQDLTPHYQKYLGRDATDEDYAAHQGNPAGLDGVVGAIVNSQEARDYGARQSDPTRNTTQPVDAATPAAAPRRGTFNNLNLDLPTAGGAYGRHEGFNMDRAMAGGDPKSVKDAFARWTTGLGFDPTTAGMGDIEAAIRGALPSARDYGLNILDVQGDKILIETAERGPEWVDIVRGAGGGDAAWQWLTQQEFGDGGDGGFADPMGQLRGMPGGSDILQALLSDGGLGGSDLLKRIQDELQKLLTGQSASNPNAPTPGGGGGVPAPSGYPAVI